MQRRNPHQKIYRGMSLEEFVAFKPAPVDIEWPSDAVNLSDAALVALAVDRFEAVYWAWSDRRAHFHEFGGGEPLAFDHADGFWASIRTPPDERTATRPGGPSRPASAST
ncbi:hypothetical protein [Pelomonas aquatica]|uniref:Uncharacterized protein n=1 Tax=Pelomonas aquatica TaxID=431058 RepID=A0A9X4LJT0_9BURK|nr:hypothetical protein [Pelomonas aquatica]MCY4754661.1 hypothetical protein [Pelomonas aquatica]MDG0863747.1 hypothetical protein [Pelomonas aquatica]